MIWRRLLVSSDSNIEDLHYTLQIAMGWEDIHVHYFTIHGQQYGISQPGGTISLNTARELKLKKFGFREKEHFLYEYDFWIPAVIQSWRYRWRHKIRVEAIKSPNPKQIYPVCTAGFGVCPPENCGGPWGFMEAKEKYSVGYFLERFHSMLLKGDFSLDTAFEEDEDEESCDLHTWLKVYQNNFDRHEVNRRLKIYALWSDKSTFHLGELDSEI